MIFLINDSDYKVNIKMLSKKLENLKVGLLVWVLVAVVLVSALLFFVLSFFGHGIVSTTGSTCRATLWDSLYFSVVTISSLGYGDFRPVGFGRLVAAVEVISGLIIIAIIVSKLASDRTSTYVRLLYTSDSERRLKEFQSDIDARVHSLKASQKNHDHDQKLEEIKSLGLIAVNLEIYYQYQVRVGALGEEWAKKNALRIARSLTSAAEQLGVVGKTELISIKERQSISRTLGHINRAINTFAKTRNTEEFEAHSDQISRIIASYERHVDMGWTKSTFGEITPYLLDKVKSVLPPKPWGKNLHKEIAEKLRISKKLSHKVISKIDSESQSMKGEVNVKIEFASGRSMRGKVRSLQSRSLAGGLRSRRVRNHKL